MNQRVAVLQSNYIPWKGYFDIIHDVDVFIFYDDLQFTKNDWRNRNKIKTANGSEWLTIPVGADARRLICEVALPDSHWQARHWKTLSHQYGKCPYFEKYRSFFEDVYLGRRWTNLSELNHHLIKSISHDILGAATTFRDSREFSLSGQKLDRLVDLVTQAGTSVYVTGPSARDYIEPGRFEACGVTLEWKDYAGYPEYRQRHAPFDHRVSILDLIFNVGAEAPWYIWGWREAGAR